MGSLLPTNWCLPEVVPLLSIVLTCFTLYFQYILRRQKYLKKNLPTVFDVTTQTLNYQIVVGLRLFMNQIFLKMLMKKKSKNYCNA